MLFTSINLIFLMDTRSWGYDLEDSPVFEPFLTEGALFFIKISDLVNLRKHLFPHTLKLVSC
jgi:hypothetical protein